MDHTDAIPVLFLDDALLAINKPAEMASLPDGYNPTISHLKSLLQPQFGRLWVVHRLDKDTSGVMVLARTAQAHRSLNTQFEQHTVVKVYHALVIGSPEWQEKTVDLALRPNGDRQHRTVVDQQHGKRAFTHLKVLERFGRYTLLEAVPEMGRTHQIRAHISALNLAIVGDKLYKARPEDRMTHKLIAKEEGRRIDFAVGMGLHAWLLALSHPITEERLRFTAPYPAAWEAVLQRLRS